MEVNQAVSTTVVGDYWQWRGQNIYYVQAGKKKGDYPPLLLIHGFGASTDHWRKNIATLQTDFKVYAIDLLGFGRSSKPDWVYSGKVWEEQLAAFIQEVVGEAVVLAGNSLGGYACLCVGGNHPELTRGVVLLNSAGPFSDQEKKDEGKQEQLTLKQKLQKTVRSILLQPWSSFLLFQYVRRKSMIRKTLKQVYLDQSAVTDQLVEDIYRPSCDRGAAKVFASVFKSPRGDKVDELLKRLTVPLLLLWGEGDPWMDTRTRSSKFHQYYSQISERFLNAGHCPHDEVPQQVNEGIKDWIISHQC
ncbi:alpha/beta fold hydrolase [Dactylococcopsis salina]|uniref:Hydrolase or acyltransferase of alpha/beta superfamily n=1 Tax=Dactylococcopsis salina (strain PCC 8305) TaxID=13035 RepID=K9YT84_DACS8|nr:alpha/beta fold hydrolase [Dactylococcopsis salina]AFZ49575.1 putative hydrolase or acyltransferase of alpha/beta superfamily [Dactylococcopsis salina PCC 8305]